MCIRDSNNGVALERSGSEVNLRRADGSVLELAELSSEWSAQEIPYSVTGSYNYTAETGWNWMDLTSDGSVQLGKATGEVMSICNNFEGALMKAIRSLEQHRCV